MDPLYLSKPLFHITSRLAQTEVVKRSDLCAGAWETNGVDPNVHRANLLYKRALLELMARSSREHGIESSEEAMRLRCRNAGGNAGAIR